MRIRSIAKRVYRAAFPKQQPAFDGIHSHNFWESRDAETPTYEGAWATKTFPARQAIARAVASLPGDSILEIGSHAGQNLWAIAQEKPDAHLSGIELSPIVLEFSRATLPTAVGRSVELVRASAEKLPFPDKSFDVVLTGGAMLCIGPEAIDKSLTEIVRVCRGYIVMAEPFCEDAEYGNAEGKKELYPNTAYWIRNYSALLAGRAKKIGVHHLPPEHHMGHLNSISILKVFSYLAACLSAALVFETA